MKNEGGFNDFIAAPRLHGTLTTVTDSVSESLLAISKETFEEIDNDLYEAISPLKMQKIDDQIKEKSVEP